MSSQRGNVSRSRKQKYTNSRGFKNDMHDTSNTMKLIKSLTHEGLCRSCKDKIEWKVKYKKYKPLTQPATCVRCHNKCVKRAYLIVCQPCAEKAEVCAKCNEKKKIVLQVQPNSEEAMAMEEMNRFELMQLSERQRRTVVRYVEKGGDASTYTSESSRKGKRSDNAEAESDDDDDHDDGESEVDPKDLNEINNSDDAS